MSKLAESKRIAIIGGGIAGLASAIRLAAVGYEVELFEANDTLGGKIAERRLGQYRFDLGPSVLTKPQFIDELFELAGEDPRKSFNYVPLDPIFQYFFEDGTILRTYLEIERLVKDFTSKTSVRPEDLRTFFKRSEEKLKLTEEVFLERSLHNWKNYFDWPTVRGIINFHKVEAFTTMAKANSKLLKDEKVVSIFNQYASYNGSNPFMAPATLNLISHFEVKQGAFYPIGGIRSVVNALVGLAERVGVNIRLNSKVKRLIVENGTCTGLVVNDKKVSFDLTVSNTDISRNYRELMPKTKRPQRVLNQPKSSSAVVFCWAMKKSCPELNLHNMFMSNNQEEEFNYIFNKNQISEDPTLYLYISSKLEKKDAPDGCENWFTLVSTPHNTGQDWDGLIRRLRMDVLNKYHRILGEDVSSNIHAEFVMDPRTFEQHTGTEKGAIFGNSSNGKFAAFLRHPNFSSQVKNLYFCGGSVHPGSGIPLCLLSAKIVTNLISKSS